MSSTAICGPPAAHQPHRQPPPTAAVFDREVAMSVGEQYVRTEFVTRDFDLVSRSEIERMVARGDDEDVHYLNCVYAKHFQKAIEKIGEFADDDTDTTGGTMGLPHICPKWMYIVESCLGRSILNAMKAYFEPPFNDQALAIRAMVEVTWGLVNFADPDD